MYYPNMLSAGERLTETVCCLGNLVYPSRYSSAYENSVTFLQNSNVFVYGLPWDGNLTNYS